MAHPVYSPPVTGVATLPSLSALDHLFVSKPSDAVATGGSPLAQSSQSAFNAFKPYQLPALSLDPQSAGRPLASGRPGSPFSFGNPPSFQKLSPGGRALGIGGETKPWATYDQSAERELISDTMDVEHTQQPRGPPSSFGPHRLTLDNDPTTKDHFPEGFDYTMRRHSIAAVQSSDPNHVPLEAQGAGPRSPFHPSLQGIKRKISHGSIIYNGQTPVETEFQEPFRSPMDPEPPKRRGSAFDTRGMAQMSLNERRDSVDSGQFAPPNSNWWERRDSTTSVYSNASVSSMGGYTSSYSGDGKQPWPPINRNPQTHLPEGLPTARQYSLPDNRTPTAAAHGSVPYPDRRMSVPDATIAAASAVRNFRSRSRPPSRGVSGSQSVTPPHLPQITATLVNPIDGYAETGLALPPVPQSHPPPVPGNGQQGSLLQTPKDSPNSTTPYSRSPELRISHKLAERKRRREMKELFDELRDNLPADRGMKSSKWEILSKAIDYIGQIRSQHHEMAREIEALKNEIDVLRGGHPPSNGHHSYAGSLGYQQGYGTTPPSRSSHYPAAGPPPPAL